MKKATVSFDVEVADQDEDLINGAVARMVQERFSGTAVTVTRILIKEG